MKYFLIYGCENGTRILQFENSEKLIEYLQCWGGDESIEFMDYISEGQKEFYCGDFIVIRGEVVKPEPINIVKTYRIS